MKQREHLPVYGVGPVYGAVVILLTVLGIVMTHAGAVPVVRYGHGLLRGAAAGK